MYRLGPDVSTGFCGLHYVRHREYVASPTSKAQMPLTKISAPKHIPCPKVKALADAAQDALVKTCNVPVKDLFQLIARFESEEMILDQTFGGVSRSRDACIVEVTFLRGRTDDQKRNLFQQVVASATEAGFRPDDIMIALTENSHADWSLGLGVAYADHVKSSKQGDT